MEGIDAMTPARPVTTRRIKAELDVFLLMPIAVSKKSVEYIWVIMHVSPGAVSARSRDRDGRGKQNAVVTAAGVHLTLTTKIANSFLSVVAKAKAQIDPGVLDALISDAAVGRNS